MHIRYAEMLLVQKFRGNLQMRSRIRGFDGFL